MALTLLMVSFDSPEESPSTSPMLYRRWDRAREVAKGLGGGTRERPLLLYGWRTLHA